MVKSEEIAMMEGIGDLPELNTPNPNPNHQLVTWTPPVPSTISSEQ